MGAVEREIDKHSVISFDLFDTLFVRPFAAPRDAFKRFGVEFWAARQAAEKQARVEVGEPTIDDIYRHLPAYDKKDEISWEFEICRPRAEIVQILIYARERKKKVIIVSDMYLPSDILADLLARNGIKYDKLYVSCDQRKTKASGELYRHVIEDLGVQAGDILHFGDNAKADIIKAAEIGLDTHYTPKVAEGLLTRYPRLKQLSIDTFAQSHWFGLQAIDSERERPYWERIGYMFGVFPLAYIQWIKERVEMLGIRQLAFVARDGDILKWIYERLDKRMPCAYVYANRHMLRSGKDYADYFASFRFNGKIGIVDTLTIRHSSYRLMAIPDSLLITVIDKRKDAAVPSISYNKSAELELHNWDFFELLMTSPELPIVDVVKDGAVYRPVYAGNDEETARISAIRQIHKGIKDFVRDCMDVRFIYREVVPIMNNFFDNLSAEDKSEFAKIKHSPRGDHDRYRSIFA